jgi:class 3 adenylate cyclase
MEKQAKGGEIVVSSKVYDKVRHIVHLDSCATVTLKGIDEPVLIYRVSSSIGRC